jgi:glutathione peroxidase-family protein
MRLLFIIFFAYSVTASAQSSIYSLATQTATGNTINLSDYKGQKILIASVSQNNLDQKTGFTFWDSLQKANPSVRMLIIPANDFDTALNSVLKTSIIAATPANIILAPAAQVKKDKGQNQQPIMKWFTSVTDNNHFDVDVTTDIQIYVINEYGELYAVLDKSTHSSELNEVLKKNFKQQIDTRPIKN